MTATELVEIIATNIYEIDWVSNEDVREFVAWQQELISKYGPDLLPNFEFPKEKNDD